MFKKTIICYDSECPESVPHYHDVEETEFKILCPYCEAAYTAEMLEDMDLCEGSYTPDCVGSKIQGSIEIYCSNCDKLVYKKEINKNTEGADKFDDNRWR